MEEVFAIHIDNRSRPQTDGQGGEWLSLPTTTEQLHAAMRSVGLTADNPQDFIIDDYSYPEGKRLALPRNIVYASGVDELNFLAARVAQLPDAERHKMNAALQRKQGFENIGQIIDFTYNVDYFVHIPEVQTSRSLGDYYLNRSGMVQMPEEWKAGIDLADFGRNAAQQEQGEFTNYGYLVKSGDEWERRFEGREVPEEYRVMSFPQPERGAAGKEDFDAPAPRPVTPIIPTASRPDDKLKELTAHLEQGISEVFQQERYTDYLRVMSKFHNYSFNNTLLIAMQAPDATHVMGFNAWKDPAIDRHVKAKEQGIRIIAPSPYKTKRSVKKIDPDTRQPVLDKDGKPVMEEQEISIPQYRVVTVFDIAQTEGKELPQLADELTGGVAQYGDFFAALEKTSPFAIGFEALTDGVKGRCIYEEQRIAINEGMGELQNIKTAIHEIAHATLHDTDRDAPEHPDRRTREVQAESIAYAVCQHYGLDTSDYSFGYIAGWSSGRELAELKGSLETIRSTAAKLIDAIDGHFAEIQQTQEQTAEQGQQAPPDPAAEPTVTIIWSESPHLQDGETMTLSRANALFKELDEAELARPGYDKTKFAIDCVFDGQPDHYEGRQDFGDGDGGLIEHIEKYHAHYADNPEWDNYLLHNEGKEALEADKAHRAMLLQEYIPYLKLHCALSDMEQTAAAALQDKEGLTPAHADYYAALGQYVSDCRGLLNRGEYDLPPAPRLADFDRELSDYKEQVKAEIAQEAADAGMTVEEYAANDFEPRPAQPEAAPAQQEQPAERQLTDLQKKAVEIAEGYKGLPLQGKIDVIAQTFGATTGKIATSPCTGKWRGTSDMSIQFDNGASLFIGNHLTPKAKTVKVQTECVDAALSRYNPEIVRAAKEAALAPLLVREAKDNAIAEEKGLKPYTLLNVEFNTGTDETNGGYLGWYYVTLAVDGKICAHLETGLNHDIADGKVSDAPKREKYYVAGALKETDVDYVFNNVGFSSASGLYSLHMTEEVRERAEKALAQRQEAQPAAEQPEKPGAAPYYSINESAARRAKEMNSFSDYQPGSATAAYRQSVDEAVQIAQRQKARVDPMYHEKIDSLLDAYARKLAANLNASYSIEARVPSILITGGSNFPVRKKEKQNAARDRNMQEWQDIQGLLDKIRSTGMGGISADDPQAVPKLESKLAGLEKLQEKMKAVNAYFRKHKTLDGCPDLTPEQGKKLVAGMASYDRVPYPSWALSNNNAEIRRLKTRIASLTQQKEVGFVGWAFDGGKVEANTDANRLQIFFDDKPDEATREELKGGGFRWSPKEGAWQRQLTANAYYAADHVKAIAPLTGEKPTALQRAHIRAQQQQAAQTPQEQPAAEAAAPEQTAPPAQDTFSIYQLKRGDETRNLRFEPYDRLLAAGNTVDRANYELVYSAELAPGASLEDIFVRFNIDHPKDFTGHSLSMSDIIVLHQEGKETAHYIDRGGYREVPEFLGEQKQLTPDRLETGETIRTPRGTFYVTAMTREQMEAAGYGFHHQSDDGKYFIMGNGTRAFAVAAEPENPLRAAEQTTEQNYNMIDGVINNTPPTPTADELEARAKAGQQISLADYAAAVKADEGREKAAPQKEEKPSIRAQLKAAKEQAAQRKPAKEKSKSQDREV